MTLEEVLTAALDDENRARATYRAVLDAYGESGPASTSWSPRSDTSRHFITSANVTT